MKLLKKLFKSNSNKKPIVLNCYTSNAQAFEYHPVQKTAKFIPDWFKRVPASIDVDGSLFPLRTVKTCPGIVDTFTTGAVIPLWSDFLLEMKDQTNEEYRFAFTDGLTKAGAHPVEQRGDYLPPNKFTQLKIDSPWLLTCDERIDFILLQNMYFQEDPSEYASMLGIHNFYDTHSTNFNFIFPRKKEWSKVEITAGTPLTQIIPMSDRPIEIRCHLITTEQWKHMDYGHVRHHAAADYKKKRDSGKVKKCPFHRS